MKTNHIFLTTLLALLIALPSCLDNDNDYDDYEKRLQEELDSLEAYMLKYYPLLEPTESGLYYLDMETGTGDSAQVYNYVTINYVGYLLDSTMFDTNVDTMAIKGGIYDEDRSYEPYKFMLGSPYVLSGVQQGVSYMKEGGKARVVFPSYLGYGTSTVGIILPYSSLIFDIHLILVEQ